MDIDKDRRLGIEMAKALGASKTLEAIECKDACFPAILKAGVAELGLDAVVSQILQGPPEWAHQAYLHIPNLGSQRDALLKRADEAPPGTIRPDSALSEVAAVQAKASVLTTPPFEVDAMNLSNKAWIVCNWTLKWIDQHGNEQPKTANSDPNSWLWTGNITLDKQSDQIGLQSFGDHVPNSNLFDDNLVWMYVYVRAGNDQSSNTNPPVFLFGPGSGQCANFEIDGGNPDPSLGFAYLYPGISHQS